MTCPICAAAMAGPRCDACGAACAPGGYAVERLLSQTLHGRLYVARAPGSAGDGRSANARGERVALKELVFALAPDAQAIDLFEREARVLAELSHPAI